MYIWSIFWLFFKFHAVVVYNFNIKNKAIILTLIPCIELSYSKYDDSIPSVSINIKWLNLCLTIDIDFNEFSKYNFFGILPAIRYQNIELN